MLRLRSISHMLMLAVVLAGCGQEEAPASPEPAPGTPPPPASSTPAPTVASAAPPVAAAPTDGPTYPAEGTEIGNRLRGVAPLPINPQPQMAGTASLSAVPCRYDGPAFVSTDGTSVIGEIAWSTDGSLYVIDAEHKLRRYTVAPGTECRLRMDSSFGTGGFYSTGDIIGRYLEGLSADEHGHVIASTGASGSYRITAGRVDYACPATRGRVRVNQAGTTGIAIYGSTQRQRITFADTGCTVDTTWQPAAGNLAPPDRDPNETIYRYGFSGDRLFVAAVSPTMVREIGLDGQPIGAAFGPARGGFCSVGQFFTCGHGLCATDYNCKEMRIFDAQRRPIGDATLHRLVGLPNLTAPHGMTHARSGVAYIALSNDLARGNGVYEGFIFRLQGL